MEQEGIRWRQVLDAFADWTTWLFAVVAVGNLAIIKYWTAYFPNLIDFIGYRDAQGSLLSIPPYVLALICTLVGGFSVSKNKQFSYHMALFLSISSCGFVLMAIFEASAKVVIYLSACLACCGAFPAFAILMAWLGSHVKGHTKRAVVIGFVVGTGQIGGIILPHILFGGSIPALRTAHIVCAIIMAATALVALFLRIALNKHTSGKTRAEILVTQSQEQVSQRTEIDHI